MPNHRKRLGFVSEIAGSPESSASSLHSVHDLESLKDVVLDLVRRLEVLEKVFVFVDFEQINQVIAKLGKQGNLSEKVGTDRVLSAPWDPLPAASEEEQAHLAPKSKCKSSPSLSRAENWSALPDTPGAKRSSGASLAQAPRAVGTPVLQPLRAPGKALPGSPKDAVQNGFKDSLRFGLGLTSPKDDMEQRSTSSSWNQTFSSWGGEADVDPERFKNFMKQAIRPRWKAEAQKESQTQNGKGDERGAENDVDAIIGAILEEKSKQKPQEGLQS
eukprot:TRINITY_DN95219_c0_g1_i1.p1 TRINITY_DN95219_c0_g1~~TRINITY_DN95219_c0_g1_i1.p1  ORF type:complete len:282 (-),score=71.68 TRINITY_DN95219_c0_g1_i1:139-957(-)